MYVLVMIEHFSKWIELVALPDKFSEGAAYSFLDRVLSRFGAPTEVLTDQGREFLGEFQTLCEPGLSVGQAARPPDTPDRPSRQPDKGQMGID
jgi:hypothetical protein